jgi:hypothetical protein
MAVTMAMEAMRRGTEAAIDRAAIGPAVRTRHGLQSGAAAAPHKTHRYSADGGATHQCQHDAARAFHVAALRCPKIWLFEDLAFSGMSPSN